MYLEETGDVIIKHYPYPPICPNASDRIFGLHALMKYNARTCLNISGISFSYVRHNRTLFTRLPVYLRHGIIWQGYVPAIASVHDEHRDGSRGFLPISAGRGEGRRSDEEWIGHSSGSPKTKGPNGKADCGIACNLLSTPLLGYSSLG